jgi:ribonuclease HI
MQKENLFHSNEHRVAITTDGGSRGNPGPAACGYTINNAGYGEYLGIKTNNEAEYAGIILALKKTKAPLGKEKAKYTEVDVRMDSELLVKQFNNEYKITVPHLMPLYVAVHNLTLDFKKITFVHIPREENKAADAMVNKTLDEKR